MTFANSPGSVSMTEPPCGTPLPGKSGVYRPHGQRKESRGHATACAALSCRELPTLVQLIERTANASGQILGEKISRIHVSMFVNGHQLCHRVLNAAIASLRVAE